MTRILRVDGSMRRDGSTTRRLTDEVVERLGTAHVTVRDLAAGVELIDDTWIQANFTDPAERTGEQSRRLAASDTLVAELEAADVVVIGMPIYNFGVPAALKAWVDLIARARVTFRYTENGAVGLMTGKRAIVVVASGGTAMDGDVDFATPWIRQVLSFIGIEDVSIVAADRQMLDADAATARASKDIDDLAA